MNIVSCLFHASLALSLVGCASARRQESAPLPFRVALIPVETDPSLDSEPREGLGATELSLALDGERISQLLNRALDERCFSSSVLLAGPDPAESTDFASWSRERRNEYWVAAAERAGADMIVHPVLGYDPAVYTATNDRFWPNVLLFLLGGPMTWVMNDRSYFVNAKLETEVFDLNPFRSSQVARLSDANFRLLEEARSLNEVTLDFIDRADGNLGSYALSVLVPSGFLAKETEAVKRHLETQIIERLCADIVQSIRERGGQLVKASSIAPFYVPEIERVGDELRGHVVLEVDSSVDSMRSMLVSGPDGESIEQVDFHGMGEELRSGLHEQLRYEFRVPIPARFARSKLRVRFVDANDTSRSNTVEPPGAREAAFHPSER